MKRIYLAGALNSDAVGYIKNLSLMIKAGVKARNEGNALFIPGLDILLGIADGNWGYEDYFNNSQPWLDVADELWVLPNWKVSSGTKKEIKRFKSKDRPIIYLTEEWLNDLS